MRARAHTREKQGANKAHIKKVVYCTFAKKRLRKLTGWSKQHIRHGTRNHSIFGPRDLHQIRRIVLYDVHRALGVRLWKCDKTLEHIRSHLSFEGLVSAPRRGKPVRPATRRRREHAAPHLEKAVEYGYGG